MEVSMADFQAARYDRWHALGVSAIVGSLVGAFGIALSDMLARGTDPVASIPIFLLSAMFSFPVWSLGIGLMGLPVHAVLDRFGFGGPIVSTLIGSVMVGVIWSFANWPHGEAVGSVEWWSKAGSIMTGFLAGAAAGLLGWKAGQPKATP
jgi:hypothetical protein